MSRTIQFSKKARWDAVGLCIIGTFMVAMCSFFLWHIRDETSILAMFGPLLAVTICANLPSAVGGLLMVLRRLRTGELLLDGDTVTVRSPGRSEQSFNRANFRGYLPHRNAVITDDDTAIALPVTVPWQYWHESEMAEPWMKAWWPGVDVPHAIRRAEAARGWIDSVPMMLRFVLGILLLFYMIFQFGPSSYSVPLSLFGLLFACIFWLPDFVERLLNRRVIISRELLDELSRADSAISSTPESTREPRRDDCAEI